MARVLNAFHSNYYTTVPAILPARLVYSCIPPFQPASHANLHVRYAIPHQPTAHHASPPSTDQDTIFLIIDVMLIHALLLIISVQLVIHVWSVLVFVVTVRIRDVFLVVAVCCCTKDNVILHALTQHFLI